MNYGRMNLEEKITIADNLEAMIIRAVNDLEEIAPAHPMIAGFKLQYANLFVFGNGFIGDALPAIEILLDAVAETAGAEIDKLDSIDPADCGMMDGCEFTDCLECGSFIQICGCGESFAILD